MNATVPAEHIVPGVGHQVINVRDPRTGEFKRQKHAYGAEAQVRALAEILFVRPDVDPDRWAFLRAVAIGRFPNGETFPISRDGLIAHCGTCQHCQTDDGNWKSITTMEVAEFVWSSHLLAAAVQRSE